MKIALIDSDIICYRAAFLHEDAGVEDAIRCVVDMHIGWTEAARCDGYLACLSTQANFRKNWWPEYKADRKKRPRPIHLSALIGHVQNNMNSCWHYGWEADDVMGYLATYPTDVERVIVTIDKDLDQIPGMHCNPDKETIYEVSDDDADLYSWMQVLSGDSTDNYPGIPKIGDKKAAAILADAQYGDRESVVRAAYTERGLTEEYLLQMTTCAKILRYTKELECAICSSDTTSQSPLQRLLSMLQPASGSDRLSETPA